MNLYIGLLFFLLANIIAWFQFNAQFISKWWSDKPLLINFLLAVPMGLCFWFAIKNIVEATGELWASKLIGFGVSNVVFAIFTYIFMGESIFTTKTMTCMFLASIIIYIQIFWK